MLLAGEFGFGSLSRDWIEVRMADTSYVGLHLECREHEFKFSASPVFMSWSPFLIFTLDVSQKLY